MHHRRAVTEMLTLLGVSAVTPAFAQGRTVEISMKNSPKAVFSPEIVNIKLGDRVNWTNPGFIAHTVTFDPSQAMNKENVVLPSGVAPFASKEMEEGATFSYTFSVKGTYKYICAYHEEMGMVGSVIVS